MRSHLSRVIGALTGRERFDDTRSYWERRYAAGGTSGSGSYGRLAQFKAEILNAFVSENDVRTVLEFGCGDGHQLGLARYPSYTGLDVSATAVQLCKERFADDPTKSFFVYTPDDPAGAWSGADLTCRWTSSSTSWKMTSSTHI